MNLKTKAAIFIIAMLAAKYKPRVRISRSTIRQIKRGALGAVRLTRRNRYAKLALGAAAFFGATELLRMTGVVTPERWTKFSMGLDRLHKRWIEPVRDLDLNNPATWVSVGINLFEKAASRAVAMQEAKNVTVAAPKPDPITPILDSMGLAINDLDLHIGQAWNGIVTRDLALDWSGCQRKVILTAEELEGMYDLKGRDLGIIALGKGPFEESVCAVVAVDSLASGLHAKAPSEPQAVFAQRIRSSYRGAWAWLDEDGELVANDRMLWLVAPADPDLYEKAWAAARDFIWPSGALLLEGGRGGGRNVPSAAENVDEFAVEESYSAPTLLVSESSVLKAMLNSAKKAGKRKRMSIRSAPAMLATPGIYKEDHHENEAIEVGDGGGPICLKPFNLADAKFFGDHTEHYAIWMQLLEKGVQHHVMLEGDPGCGKSTLVREFARSCGRRVLFVDHSAVHRVSQTMWQALMHLLGVSVLVFEDLDKAGSLDRRLWMFEHQDGVGLLFSTANEPRRFSEAVRRAGRLGDQVIRVGKPGAEDRAALVNNLIWRHDLPAEAMTPGVKERAVKLCATHPISAVERFLIFAAHVGPDVALLDLPGDVTYHALRGGQIDEDDFETQREVSEEESARRRAAQEARQRATQMRALSELARDVGEAGGFEKLSPSVAARFVSDLELYDLAEAVEDSLREDEDESLDGDAVPSSADMLADFIGESNAAELRRIIGAEGAPTGEVLFKIIGKANESRSKAGRIVGVGTSKAKRHGGAGRHAMMRAPDMDELDF